MSTPTRPRYTIYPITIKETYKTDYNHYYCFKDNDREGLALYYIGESKDFFKLQCAEDAISFVNLLNSKEGEYLSKI
jgi:hypothetical protein